MADPQKSVNPQKSEVHAETDDADGSPVASGEVQRGDERPTMPHGEVRQPTLTLGSAAILRDDTDVGGPLVIASADPDLNPPRVPIDPFPTDRTPQIDVPVERD